MNDLIVDWGRRKTWFFLMKRYSLTATWTWPSLHAHPRFKSVICSRRGRRYINGRSLSCSWLAWNSAPCVTILAVCCNIAGHRFAAQLGNHFLSVHLGDLLDQFVHHGLILHYLGYVYDLAFLKVVKDEFQILHLHILLLNRSRTCCLYINVFGNLVQDIHACWSSWTPLIKLYLLLSCLFKRFKLWYCCWQLVSNSGSVNAIGQSSHCRPYLSKYLAVTRVLVK